MNKLLLVLVLALGVFGLFYLYNYVIGFPSGSIPAKVQETVEKSAEQIKTQTGAISDLQPVEYKVEVAASDLYVPWSIVFTNDQTPGRMLFTERDGNVRELVGGVVTTPPLLTIQNLSEQSEEGLMGMVLHPQYETNKFVYLAYAYPNSGDLAVRVERYKDEGSKLTLDKAIIENLPAATNHAGTRLRFGADGKLYVTVGDATDRNIAQDMKSFGGKILRLNDDGSIPSDNPFANSPIYSLGHRNPQGIYFHPETNDLWETEHGPSVFDGPAGGDEVNLIIKGKNYGWPIVSHDKTDARFESPKVVYTPAVAPASGMFYSGKMFPQYKNVFFFGGLRGEGVYWIKLDASGKNIVEKGRLEDINVGRVREIAEGPDGSIYFSTSNQDGRGSVNDGDDKIYRIVKK